ncbi:Carboxylesterase type B [Macrophomina phaseolina MS6]|uniref:Carboxylic ester hydrolase n=1 Tax=Macrophomina phaseolina (strain MS6) TaxID=1126212 RepID=K2RVJ5_MACPH|nr:Carboxylesterase type B [Macrophomina phaseolina MS6]
MGIVDALADSAACLTLATSAIVTAQAGNTCDGVPTALTSSGLVQGFTEDTTGNHVFLGIPFADSTAGGNRWKPPVSPATSWDLFNATEYGSTCAQASVSSTLAPQGEDCLNLNVWTPATGTNLPVFVYIYGGAMVTGGSSNPQWQGSNFASKDVVYVNFNYRESIFGAPNSAELADELDGTSQNLNILDVEAAVQWVYDNVAAFGGNKDHIVIGGHSSGSVMVDHYLWNHPDTFLAGAIEMSANAESGPGYAPEDVGLNVVKADVANSTGEALVTLNDLRQASFYDIETSKFNSTYNTWFAPIVDNITRFQDYPGRFAAGNYPKDLPLIVGNSDQEGKIFSLVYSAENTDFSEWINTFDADLAHVPDDDLLASYNESDYESVSLMSGASYGDARFFCPTDYLLDIRASEQPTWIYRWFGNYSNVLGVDGMGASHGSEVPFFHGGNQCFEDLEDVTEEQQALADWMNDWFVAWIKNPAAGPGWDKATPTSGPLAKVGVPGNETEVIIGDTSEYNSRCQNLYKPNMPKYPVVQDPTKL